jgi:predicted ferric reductase
MDKYKLRKQIFLAVLIATYLPPIFLADYRGAGSAGVLLLGRLFGMLGVILITWQFLLGIRGLVSRIIPDLLWINSIHRFIGTYGFLAICLHPLLVTIYYASVGVNLLVLKFDDPFNFYKAFGTAAFALLTLTWLLSAFARKRLGFRYWKKLHLLVYVMMPLILIHSLNLGVNVGGKGFLHYYWLFIVAVFITAFTYRILLRLGVFRDKYVITEVNHVTKDTTQVVMKPKGSKYLSPEPGQFVYFQPGLLMETHPFTVSHFDNTTHMLAITAKSSGPFSAQVQNLKVGQTVYLDGPFGEFTAEAYLTDKPIVLIAGGIGITPFLKLIESAKTDLSKRITLIWGNKTQADIAFADLMQAVGKANPGFKLVNVLSGEPTYSGEKGYITTELIQKYVEGDLANYEFFVCGPPVMMDKIMPALDAAGIPESQLHKEKFSL